MVIDMPWLLACAITCLNYHVKMLYICPVLPASPVWTRTTITTHLIEGQYKPCDCGLQT